MIEVKQIAAADTKSLRHLVLWPHIPNEEDCVIDIDERPDAIHLGVFESGSLVSIGSLFEQVSPKLGFTRQVRLRAMATHPDVRGKQHGRLLVEHALLLLKKKDYEVIWCDARLIAIGFYSSLGFHILPEVYDIPRIGPHQFMWKEVQ
jgi:predicted GNAT family N-acyltransferase